MRRSSTKVNANSVWGQQAERNTNNNNNAQVLMPDSSANMTPLTQGPQILATTNKSQNSKSSAGTPTSSTLQQQIWQRDLLHYSPPDSSRLLPPTSHSSSQSSPQITPSTQPVVNNRNRNNDYNNNNHYTNGSRSNNNYRRPGQQRQPLRISEEEAAAAAMEDQVSVLTDDQMSNTAWQTFPSEGDFSRVVVQGVPVGRQQHQQQQHQQQDDHTFEVPWDVNLLDPSTLSIAAAADDDDTINNTDHYLFDPTNSNEEEGPRPVRSSSRRQEATTTNAPRRGRYYNNYSQNDQYYHDDNNHNTQPQSQQQQHEPYHGYNYNDNHGGDDTTTTAAAYMSVAASAGNSLRSYESRDTPNMNDHDGNDDHSSTIAPRPTVISTTAPPPPPLLVPRDALVQPDASVAPLEPAITQEEEEDYVFETPRSGGAAAAASSNINAAAVVSRAADMDAQLARMVAEGYPSGLARAMVNLKNSEVAHQIWIVDNSGSMTTYDGTRLVAAGSALQFVKCTRWEELQDCVSVHLKLSGAIGFPMTVRLLNDPGPIVGPPVFGIGSCEHNNFTTTTDTTEDTNSVQTDMHRCLGIMNLARPFGASPLTRHIQGIYQEVKSMESSLRSTGQKVAVVICTDGIPSDSTREDFIAQLRRLDELPITIVIRMCTDEKEVVDFYNSLDYELETSIDVIDDYQAEAEEIAKHNPWLNYGRPIHRLREKGCRLKVLDLLDERPLSKQEQVDICCLIFGREKIVRGAPNPITNWSGFQKYLDELQASEELQWDPIHRKMKPWIDFRNTREKLRALKRHAKNKKTFMERILS